MIQRLSQAGLDPDRAQTKYTFGGGEIAALATNVGPFATGEKTYVEVHEYGSDAAAKAAAPDVISFLDSADTSPKAFPRTYVVGNTVTHIRSYSGGGAGSDIERIVHVVAGQ